MLFGGLSVFAVALPAPVFAQFGSDLYVEDVGVPTAKDGLQRDKLLDVIKTFINWVLGLLATVALALCLRAGFLIVTAAGDDAKQKKGMGIIKQAAVGLIIIGISWLIVSLIFWLIETFATKA